MKHTQRLRTLELAFFINVKHRLLTIALNSMSIIFACLYWKSQGISCGLESGHPDYDERPSGRL